MTDQARPSCSNCPHYRGENAIQGFCTERPPQVFMVPGQDMSGKFVPQWTSSYPPVKAAGSCGSHPEFIRWYTQNKTRMPEIAAMERTQPEGSA